MVPEESALGRIGHGSEGAPPAATGGDEATT